LFITHQLPKGLAVDEAILLGKESSYQNEEQLTVMQHNLKTSNEGKAEV